MNSVTTYCQKCGAPNGTQEFQGDCLVGGSVTSCKCGIVTISPAGINHSANNTTHIKYPSKEPTGIKHDQDKADMSLLSNTALLKVAQVMTYGKTKYSAHNWRGGFIWSRPLAAAARHLYAYIGGEDKDPETGLSHLAHCVCCLLFVLEFEETHKELDDRFKATK